MTGKKGVGGSPASKCSGLILEALGRHGILSVEDLQKALGGKYGERTIQKHVKTLLEERKIAGGMKRGVDAGKPLYRITSAAKAQEDLNATKTS
jgi:hypothetical protein